MKLSDELSRDLKMVSIIAPFFNEEANINIFFEALISTIEQQKEMQFEIICVDDGSRDNTLDLLKAIAKSDPRVKVIELSRNFGKEAALTAGLDFAKGNAVIPIDTDLQDPPELVGEMVKLWRRGYDVVLAKRANRDADSPFKKISAELFYKTNNMISNTKIPQNVGDFRLLDRRVVDAVKMLPERQRFMKGIFAWVGFKTITIEYVRKSRHLGNTSFSPWKLGNLAIEAITGFSTAPLRLSTYLGLIGALTSTAYACYIIFKTMTVGADTPGYASIMTAIIFFGSLQFICIGLIGEYIGKIYMESKQRPIYIIRNIF